MSRGKVKVERLIPQFSLMALLVWTAAFSVVMGLIQLSRSDVVRVSGRIRYLGAPITNSNIVLVNVETGEHPIAFTWSDGQFSFPDGCRPGHYRAYFVQGKVARRQESKPSLPKKYLDPNAGGIPIQVSRFSANDIRLNLW